MVAFWLPIMLTQEEAVEIKVLMRRGAGIREMARELGCSRNTIRRYLREASAEHAVQVNMLIAWRICIC